MSGKRGIEFQDEYPFLVTSLESLEEVDRLLREEGERVEERGKEETRGQSQEEENEKEKSRPIAGFESEKWKNKKLQMKRFRPNIVIESLDKENPISPFMEDSLESLFLLENDGQITTSKPSLEETQTGNFNFKSIIHLVSRCERCRLTTVDPETSEIDKAVPLKFLSRHHFRIKKKRNGPCFGMYGIPMPVEKSEDQAEGNNYGRIRVGDLVMVRWRPYNLDDEPGRKRD